MEIHLVITSYRKYHLATFCLTTNEPSKTEDRIMQIHGDSYSMSCPIPDYEAAERFVRKRKELDERGRPIVSNHDLWFSDDPAKVEKEFLHIDSFVDVLEAITSVDKDTLGNLLKDLVGKHGKDIVHQKKLATSSNYANWGRF